MPLKSPIAVSLLAALLLCNPAARANDSSYGDINGTIVFKQQPDISMDKEVLAISQNRIQVDYVFTNNGAKDLVIPITFPMPPMYFGPTDHNAMADFQLWVDGKQVKTVRRMVVLLNQTTDITKQVEALGWSIDELIAYLSDGPAPEGKQPFPEAWLAEGLPMVTINEHYTWQQHFVAGKPVTIRHTYTPGYSSGVPEDAGRLIEDFKDTVCLDKSAQAGIRKRATEYGVDWTFLQYILRTGNNWQGPIKDFTLRIRKDRPTDLMSTCMDGDFRKIDPVTFEFHQENYRPSNDLNILFVRAPGER